MNELPNTYRLPDKACNSPENNTNSGESADGAPSLSGETGARKKGLFHFCAELRRRHVCRAATIYAVAFWLIFEVVQSIAPEVGLPDWTSKLVVVLGLIGFPIAMTVSWLVDITPGGQVLAHDRGHDTSAIAAPLRKPYENVIDCGLVLSALVIAAILMTKTLSLEAEADTDTPPSIAIVPARDIAGPEANEFADGLIAQIEHELVSGSRARVLEPPYQNEECYRLTIAVVVGDGLARVTANLSSNKTGVIAWSRNFRNVNHDPMTAHAALAQEITEALPRPFHFSMASKANAGVQHVK